MATAPNRKDDHLRIAAGPGVTHDRGPGLDAVRLRHRALPGRDLADVELAIRLLDRDLAAPLLISAMTGGTPHAAVINARLATAATERGLGFVLGSGRPLLADPGLLPTYRSPARPPLLLANLGAVGLTAERATQLVDLLGADGLSIHLNPLQEAVQPEGEPHFADVRDRIAAVVAALAPLPVVVKEVGFGMDGEDVRELAALGVAAVDVAGSGGTNWALVEGARDARAGEVAAAFGSWGVPTADSLRAAARTAPDVPLLASGGVRDGVDVARCLALGARAAGMARPLLIAAREDRAGDALDLVLRQLRIAVWATGAPSAARMGAGELA
ncbi:Isopentenyl-diphosphate delta-isomerase [Paraconexibacter sp. AEG42_29]|uniref:Isopentenyl-diphosphate delta-isomerase n=1 Tax=Paraconexibacter sp. AEG42_29 TaxID=2997339 RepID=A0AAU7AQY4_9ACTN